MNNPPQQSLSDASPNEVAVVASIDLPDDDSARLKSLGVCVGRKVQVVKQGDPLIIRVVGTRVGISARLAAAVQVQSLTQSS